jgi:hypothetical protein
VHCCLWRSAASYSMQACDSARCKEGKTTQAPPLSPSVSLLHLLCCCCPLPWFVTATQHGVPQKRMLVAAYTQGGSKRSGQAQHRCAYISARVDCVVMACAGTLATTTCLCSNTQLTLRV